MDNERPLATDPPRVRSRPTGRQRAARVCAIVCLVLVLLLATAGVVFIASGVGGCWGGAYLFLAAAVLFGIPALVLWLVVACLRAFELIWLSIAIVAIYLIVDAISNTFPAVLCSGSG